MAKFNEIWTKEKHQEYWDLKRKGYTDEMLKKYFGDDIYESDMYNRNAHIIPYDYYTKYFENIINEIKINPEKTPYNITPIPSNLELSKMDYILRYKF